jgi:hypothetical protein
VQLGVNKKICERIGIINPKILSPKKNMLRKLVTFSPVVNVEAIRAALFEAGAGHIGNYDECSYNSEGYGTFRAGDGTNPHVGEKGIQHTQAEVRIETVFPFYLEAKIISALKKVHPYEEVAYDIYQLENSHQEIGAGMVGDLENAVDEKIFLQQLKKVFKADGIRHTSLLNKKIKRVAVCGGSGSFLLEDAKRAGADVFVTADFKYHQFFDAEGKILIADIGHYEIEQYSTEIISELLLKNFSTFAVRKSEVNTNPILYT